MWDGTLRDPIRHVSFRSGETVCKLLYSVSFTLGLYTYVFPMRRAAIYTGDREKWSSVQFSVRENVGNNSKMLKVTFLHSEKNKTL